MTVIPRSIRVLVWCGLALYLVAAVVPIKSLVICFGAHGSVRLQPVGGHAAGREACGHCDLTESGETLHSNGCATFDDEDHSDDPLPGDAEQRPTIAGCHCFALPLGLGHDGPQLRPASLVRPDLLTTVANIGPAPVWAFAVTDGARPLPLWHPPKGESTVAPLKTIILRV